MRKDLLLKNGMVLAGPCLLALRDVLIADGIIQAVKEFIPVPADADTE